MSIQVIAGSAFAWDDVNNELILNAPTNSIRLLNGSGAPTNGTSGTGAGRAGPGSLYMRTSNGAMYRNANTLASPTWNQIGAISTAELDAGVLSADATGRALVAADWLDAATLVLAIADGAFAATAAARALFATGFLSVAKTLDIMVANAIVHSLLDEQVEHYADVTVSSAQLLALNATPIQLVAAPGANKALIFTGAVAFLDFNTTAYGGIAAGEDLSIKYTDGSGAEVAQLEATGFLDSGVDATRWIRPATTATGDSGITPVANAALVLHMLVGEIITGDSPLLMRTYYKTVPTVLT